MEVPMKKVWLFIGTVVISLALAGLPRQAIAAADEYDDSQSHPLRALAYVAHPFGVLVEWLLARPGHFLVSATPELEYVFGHQPHPPLFTEPQPLYDYGVPKKVPMKESPPSRAALPEQPTAEVVTVKEVMVEKPVLKEVPKIVEVERVIFPEVAFRFDSADLTDLGRGQVYLVAQRLKENANAMVVLEGHADSVGSEEYNMRLGLRRAETVKQELTQLGIDPARLSTASLGKSKPLVEQQSDWARAVNRRVEFQTSSSEKTSSR
jgi:outer membrane protein OmpA-like peptidoglycan-associated protein